LPTELFIGVGITIDRSTNKPWCRCWSTSTLFYI